MINLQKGQNINLSKTVDPIGLQHLRVSIGWDENKFTGSKFDLDLSTFALADNGNGTYKLRTGSDFCFYNNKVAANGALVYSGDNRTGEGEGDDEFIDIDISKTPEGIINYSVVVSIADADTKRLNFGMVSNSYVKITNKLTGEEICRYDLGEDFSTETAVQFGSIYLYNGEWKFKAIGQGYVAGLQDFINEYNYENN